MVALAAKPVPRMELFVCDASWRLLERRTDESWEGSGFTHDSTSQWVWGQRYIDELVASITDGDANDEFEDLFYAMTDRNFSVIGLSQSTGASGERIRYDAYGHAQASPRGDANGDGLVNIDDQDIVLANFGKQIGDTGGTATYKVEADFDSNGAIDLDDLSTVFNHFGTTIERGRLSGSGNIVGYAGYIFEPATGMYVVRHRWYSTDSGRWLSRDPLGYVDGQNVYEALRTNPNRFTDPYGKNVRPAMNAVSAVGGLASTEMQLLGNQGSAPQDDVAELRCHGIHGFIPIPHHCFVRCCKTIGGVQSCNTYGLNTTNNAAKPLGLLACFNRNNERDVDSPSGDPRGGKFSTVTGAGICDCLSGLIDSARNPDRSDGCSYEYKPYSCNSNWAANSLWSCCTGKKGGAPPTAPFGMPWDCCRKNDCGGGGRQPCPLSCPSGSRGSHLNFCCGGYTRSTESSDYE